MSNDMASCIAEAVDLEDHMNDLQSVIIQVISVHLYC